MEWSWIWKSVFLVVAGLALLRVSGRKSISQMSVATTIIMISIGTTIVQPLANHHLSIAIGSAAVFIVTLIIIEFLETKLDWMERLTNGRAIAVIENGQIHASNLRKIRLTVDQLEARLREKGISNISDVKTATLETNGLLGYELMPHARPVTVGDLEKLLGIKLNPTQQDPQFQEVVQNQNKEPINPILQ